MSKINTFINLLSDKAEFKIAVFNNIVHTNVFNILSDETFLKIAYKVRFGKKLNLDNPISFNEKLQWLKLYNQDSKYVTMVDKIAVKKYIAKIVGEDIIIPTLGVYNTFDEINFNDLPNQFVIKCNHDSGNVVICKDKTCFDFKQAKHIITKALKNNLFYWGREWPYKKVTPKIIVEKYMEDKETNELRDYKFFCFDGKVKFMFVATDRSIHDTKFNFYDLNFNLLPFTQHYPNDKRNIVKPKNFDKMVKLAETLSKDIPHVRVDFYEVNGKIYFGEFTFYHFSGFVPFSPEVWDEKIGRMLKLPKEKKVAGSDAK